LSFFPPIIVELPRALADADVCVLVLYWESKVPVKKWSREQMVQPTTTLVPENG